MHISVISIFFNLYQLLKFVDLHKTPSLEFGLVLMFSYLPYALAEGIHLSGMQWLSVHWLLCLPSLCVVTPTGVYLFELYFCLLTCLSIGLSVTSVWPLNPQA